MKNKKYKKIKKKLQKLILFLSFKVKAGGDTLLGLNGLNCMGINGLNRRSESPLSKNTLHIAVVLIFFVAHAISKKNVCMFAIVFYLQ